MANRLAAREGRMAARVFLAEHPEDVPAALAPGQLGADESLINALGISATAELFGLARGGTEAFSRACFVYSRWFDLELLRLSQSGGRRRSPRRTNRSAT